MDIIEQFEVSQQCYTQKCRIFMSETFFLQRGEIPGYRHTQVTEIHLGTLLVKGETQQYISIYQHIGTILMAKGKRAPAYLTRLVATQGQDISIHQHIDTTLMAKGKRVLAYLTRLVGTQGQNRQQAETLNQPTPPTYKHCVLLTGQWPSITHINKEFSISLSIKHT